MQPGCKHLVSLHSDATWAVWRLIGVRSAGFPAPWALGIASKECAIAADEFLSQAECSAPPQVSCKVDGRLQDRGSVPNFEPRRRRLDNLISFNPNIHEKSDLTDARFRYECAFRRTEGQVSEFIASLLEKPLFQEAVIWQNRSAFHNGLASLRRRQKTSKAGRRSQQRRNEQLVAKYLVRYCLKNECIGFFGPTGWGHYVEDPTLFMEAVPGPHLVAKRNVHFEGWAIDLLASALLDEPQDRRWCSPRRSVFLSLVDGKFFRRSRPVSVTEQHAAVLRLCDGERSANCIASRILTEVPFLFRERGHVFRALEELCDLKLVTWRLNIPWDEHPEASLRRFLMQIPDTEVREKAVATLAQFEVGLALVTESVGLPSRLDEAIDHLERLFVSTTSRESTRENSSENRKYYSGRALIYEDCIRDLTLNFGPGLLEAVGPPVELLLASARWITYELSEIYKEALRQIYREFSNRRNLKSVPLVEFLEIAHPILFSRLAAESVIKRANDTWQNILSPSYNFHEIRYRSTALRSRVLTEFAAPGPGWLDAIYHSPDILVSKRRDGNNPNGKWLFVLGELHVGSNTLRALSDIMQYEKPGDILGYFAVDLPAARLVPLPMKEVQGLTARTVSMLSTPKDRYLVLSDEPTAIESRDSIPIADLEVVPDSDGYPVIRVISGNEQFNFLDTFGASLSKQIVSAFGLLPQEPHVPRIVFDDVIVHRESWSFGLSDLTFADVKRAEDRFLKARQWAFRHKLPQRIFLKIAKEEKPLYVDFESPITVEVLTRSVRRARMGKVPDPVVVTEMTPGIDELWLSDSQGEHYTSELRMVFVDRMGNKRGADDVLSQGLVEQLSVKK